MKKLYFVFILSLFASSSFAQNWQYVGTPHINQTLSYLDYFYFYDLEINSAGNVFAGYYDTYSGTDKLNFAKYDGTSWSLLSTPATVTANGVDIEVQDNNYYIAYSRVVSSNVYAYVMNYNGSTWTQLGDSLLLGTIGGGWSFDFLIDNNGVPTMLGVIPSAWSNKEMYQYTAGSWSSVYTLPNSAATLFRENSAIFDSDNKLYCVTGGFTTQYYARIIKIDGAASSMVGDTIFAGLFTYPNLKFDGAGVPYVCFNAAAITKVMAYKLNGSTWSFVADTSGPSIGTMIMADVADDGTIVFNVLNSNVGRSVYYYSGGQRFQMDSIICTDATPTTLSDIVIPDGSTDVFALVPEVKTTVAQDFNVMKHSLSVGIHEASLLSNRSMIYPNPMTSTATITIDSDIRNAEMKIFDVTGREVKQLKLQTSNTTFERGNMQSGIYFYQVTSNGNQIAAGKLAVE